MYRFFGNLILRYFRFLATLQLKKNKKAIIIGITGSAGKTTCRLMAKAVLSSFGRVKDSEGANSESGIPLNILGLKPTNYSYLDWLRLMLLAPLQLIINWEHFDFFIVEMGIDSPNEPKNMTYLLSIVEPHIAVVLNAGLAHSANFDHLVKDRDPERRRAKLRRAIAKEKMKLAIAVAPNGTAILNTDDVNIRDLVSLVRARTLLIGKGKNTQLKIKRVKNDRQGFHMYFTYQNQDYEYKSTDYFTSSTSVTIAAALAVGATLGLPMHKAIANLESYRQAPGRLRVLRGLNQSTILDSTYNAAPQTVEDALKLLKTVAGKNQKVAIIGDMNELGSVTKSAHKKLAADLAESADTIILYGKLTGTHTLPVLTQKGADARHFTDMRELISYAKEKVGKHATILIKGSQNGIFLERATAALLANKSDKTLLCRQGRYWDSIRSDI